MFTKPYQSSMDTLQKAALKKMCKKMQCRNGFQQVINISQANNLSTLTQVFFPLSCNKAALASTYLPSHP